MQCSLKNLFLSVETFMRHTRPSNFTEAAWRDSIR
jgi:hypothetical protein